MKNFFPLKNVDSDKAFDDFFNSLDTDANNPISFDYIDEEKAENETITQTNQTDNLTDAQITPSDDNQEKQEECTALVVTKPNSLFVAQKMFKKSIKISIKSFLISLSLGFLNLFI